MSDYDYDPYYEFDEDYDEERDMEPDDCGFGSFGYPQLGVEECEFTCPLHVACREIFFSRKDCVYPIFTDEEMWRMDHDCLWFHMGSCYLDFSNHSPSRLRQLWTRLKCRLRILPKHPYARRYEEKQIDLIEEGHGRTDVSCEHGSRWIWWKDELVCPDGAWQNVVRCSACDCDDPPRPFKEDSP